MKRTDAQPWAQVTAPVLSIAAFCLHSVSSTLMFLLAHLENILLYGTQLPGPHISSGEVIMPNKITLQLQNSSWLSYTYTVGADIWNIGTICHALLGRQSFPVCIIIGLYCMCIGCMNNILYEQIVMLPSREIHF